MKRCERGKWRALISAASLLLAGCGQHSDIVPLRLNLKLNDLADRTMVIPVTVTRRCGYALILRLLHQDGRMGEYDALLVNNELPIEMRVELRGLSGDTAQPVLRKSGRARKVRPEPDDLQLCHC